MKERELIQSELANIGYFRVLVIAITTAGGNGEEQDLEINDGFDRISDFLIQLHQGRNNYWQPSFLPQPLLAKRSMEQIEEEGGSEEVDAQLVNNGIFVMHKAKKIKGLILNYFINKNKTLYNLLNIWHLKQYLHLNDQISEEVKEKVPFGKFAGLFHNYLGIQIWKWIGYMILLSDLDLVM
ncbi:MAG: hypothetical protein EZS28_018879 [Streblomastix strix]|uniref:Uncharacterized protein n=1 Tax=Streblomastix strix TaxID=222440 RepID=A0A5J4VSK4_9EUKA|nr:MAG: hypothetical protein EZS28_018879 [Streblomastix strix]